MPQFDFSTFAGQLFWLAMVFIALYWVMSKVALPKVQAVVEGREASIADDLRRADAARVAAAELKVAVDDGLAKARVSAAKLTGDAKAAAAKDVDSRIRAVEADLVKSFAEAEAKVNASKQEALGSLADVATQTAEAIIAKLTGQTIPAADAVKALVRS
jgi:F-type H+-transporting ATPase subunit b